MTRRHQRARYRKGSASKPFAVVGSRAISGKGSPDIINLRESCKHLVAFRVNQLPFGSAPLAIIASSVDRPRPLLVILHTWELAGMAGLAQQSRP